MAAELKEKDPQRKVTLIHSRDRLLSAEPLPDDFKDRVCSILRDYGVTVILGQKVVDHQAIGTCQIKRTWRLTLANNTQITAGHIMSAISKCVPTSSYLPHEALDHEGYVMIHPSYVFPFLLWLILTITDVNSKATYPTEAITSPSETSRPGRGSNDAVVPCCTVISPPQTSTSSCYQSASAASLSLWLFR